MTGIDGGTSGRSGRLTRALTALAVFGATVLVLRPALDGQFLTWDDDVMLAGNPAFRGLGWPQLRWMLTTTLLGHYMPLTWMSFGVSYVVGGMDPWGYHLASLLLHGLNAALATCLAWRLIGAATTDLRTAPGPVGSPALLALGAGVAGLAWGIHPLRAEPVAWATDRGDLLSGAFALTAVLAYARGVPASGHLAWRPWGWAALGAMALALLSKETAVVLPAALLVLDGYPLRRSDPWHRLVREKVPFLALAAVGTVVALAARSSGARFSTAVEYGAAARVAMVGHSLWYYAWTGLVPLDLAPYHEPPLRVDILVPRFLIPTLATAALTVAVVVARRRLPAALAAWMAYALVLLPVTGIVHSGSHLVAERYSYLPTIGFAMLLGGMAVAAAQAWRGAGRRRLAGAVALLAVTLALPTWATLAWRHSANWRDTLTMWQVSAAADPDCRLCAVNLAAAHFNAGQAEAAERWARRAIELWPGRGTPHHLLGAALLVQGRDREAEAELLEAVRLAPQLGAAHRELGRLYDRQGRAGQAVAAFRQALAAGAPVADTQALLADALRRGGGHVDGRDPPSAPR